MVWIKTNRGSVVDPKIVDVMKISLGSLLSLLLLFSLFVNAQEKSKLTHIPSPEERARWHEIGKDFVPTEAPTAPVRNIAEFEPTEAILVRYPFGIPVTLIKEIADDCKVITVVQNATQEDNVRTEYTSNGVNLEHCEFIHANSDSYWTRDYGPWFIADGNDEVGIVNFTYNRPRPNDNQIPIHVAAHLGVSYYNMNLAHTGGNYMCDGYGNAASTDLIWEENPSLSHQDIDDLMMEYLGIEQYHVTSDPLGDYIKHIDCWGKYLAPDKIMIGQVPETDYRYEDFEAVAEYFANTDSPYGEPYRVYRVYTPGGSPATPYTNCLIVNRKVFIPMSGSQWDDDAIATYEAAMPGYEIIGVSFGSWENTDALHCRTHEIADREMLYLHHLPVVGVQPLQGGYEVAVDITSYGDHEVYADSVYAVYRTNGGAWDTLAMVFQGDRRYAVTLPVGEEGTKVEYFIHAADMSGRSEEHPYIGASDPHKFYAGDPVGIGSHEIFEGGVLCYPNPAHEMVNIAFMLDASSTVSVVLSNPLGEVVQSPVKAHYSAGRHNLRFFVGDLPSGIYCYTLTSGTHTLSGKFVLSH
ncbi:MAG: peptidylarginine deiminase [Bacteroidetes bacterium]|nr:MAG: peptidylarginine deiminase [Bacteroidota bacterium]